MGIVTSGPMVYPLRPLGRTGEETVLALFAAFGFNATNNLLGLKEVLWNS